MNKRKCLLDEDEEKNKICVWMRKVIRNARIDKQGGGLKEQKTNNKPSLLA